MDCVGDIDSKLDAFEAYQNFNARGIQLRTKLIVVGSAGSIGFLMASLSGQISLKSSVEYNSPESFLITGLCCVALLLAIPLLRRKPFRHALSLTSATIAILWCFACLILESGVTLPAGARQILIVALYGALGRLASILIGIQWNLHFALNPLDETIRSVVATMLLGTSFFVMFSLLEKSAAMAWACVMLLSSSILNFIVEELMTGNDRSSYSLESVVRQDERLSPSQESLFRTRMLFFGSRVAYGVFGGVLVGLASFEMHLQLSAPPIAICISISLLIAAFGVLFAKFDKAGNVFAAIVTPTLILMSVTIAFYTKDLSAMARVFAVMTEAAWITQLYIQLPTYRRLVRMHPVNFAYSEKVVSLVVFEFVVYGFMQLSPENTGMGASAIIIAGGMGLFVLVISYSLGRHVLRYHPKSGENTIPNEEVESTLMNRVKNAAAHYGLTPKEEEVLSYLASGYSRPYIEKSLYIAKGTAKAHTYHIYQKLGVNSQDDLIELVRCMPGDS